MFSKNKMADIKMVVELTNDVIKESWRSVPFGGREVEHFSKFKFKVFQTSVGGLVVGITFAVTLCGSQPIVPRIIKFIKPTNATIPKILIIPAYYYGIDVDIFYYYIIAYQSIVIGIGVVVFIAADTLFIIQVQHACGMFAVVGHQLQRMSNTVIEECANYYNLKLDLAFQHLIKCIGKHEDVIEFSRLLEAFYSWVFFINVGISVPLLSYTGVQATWMMGTHPEAALRYEAFSVTSIFVLFFLFFFSQNLIDHSNQNNEYLYQAEWYKTPLASQKLLNLVTMRAYVPCQLTAGKFMVMSLKNFATVLRTSMSYFTVMRSMHYVPRSIFVPLAVSN